ncbi:MAG: hypothetical protein DBY40_02620 [Clostridiales bacterium]|nr:MAG: hypothetical protein DBY40_02620 [Clostridiales bacterium]
MTDANTGDLELLVLVLYKTEVYNKLLYALNDAGIHGATTVSSSGMAHALADAEDSHIIAAFRAFAASDRRESKTIFMVIEKAKRERVRRVVREKVGDLAQPDTGILFALPVTFADGLYETTTL